MKVIRRTRPPFTGWTEADGTRKPNAPANWPFGHESPEVILARKLRQILDARDKKAKHG